VAGMKKTNDHAEPKVER